MNAFFGLVGKDILSLIGIAYIVMTTIKISRGYPITRWFW